MAAAPANYHGTMMPRPGRVFLLSAFASLLLAGCGGLSIAPGPVRGATESRPEVSERAREAVIFALGLIDTGYRFGDWKSTRLNSSH